MAVSNDNTIYHNNLIENNENAYDNGNNTWYIATLQEGNYCSDFDEPSEGAYDNDSDGIVDSPYNISGGDNQDWFPLMRPLLRMELDGDWNLVTVPCNTTFTAATLGQNISGCSIVASWNASVGTFESFIVGSTPPSADFRIERGMGLFVYVTKPSTWHGQG